MALTWNSLHEIFESLDDTRQSTLDLLSGFSTSQESFRASPDSWSIAEIAEHISLSEDRILKGIQRALTQAESAAVPQDPGSTISVSLAEMGRQAEGRKFKSPDATTPQPGATLTASVERMNRVRDDLRALRRCIETTDLRTATFPHPVFGPLNAYEWLAFMVKHEERHVGQMRAVMSAPGFPGPDS
jgi:uncharacterized damage-inducible protein DinB